MLNSITFLNIDESYEESIFAILKIETLTRREATTWLLPEVVTAEVDDVVAIVVILSGIDFTNILQKAFTRSDPRSAKRD